MEKKHEKEGIKVIFLHETAVGATNIIRIFTGNEFSQGLPFTVYPTDFSECWINNKNKKYCLHLWDIPSYHGYRAVNKFFTKGSDIVIFVFDITRRSTFEELSFWTEYVKEILDH